MLLQSNNGCLEIFPAIPATWKNVTFKTLRTEGAFLVSAKKSNGNIEEVLISSEAGGLLQLELPFKKFYIDGVPIKYTLENNILKVNMRKGESILFKNGFE